MSDNKDSESSSESIQVVVRIRKLLGRETDPATIPSKWRWSWNTKDRTVSLLQQPSNKHYTFDQIFGPDSDNYDLYKTVVSPRISCVMEGFHYTIFAYGQTASGKTFTMHGSQDQKGIIHMAVDQVFKYIENSPVEQQFLIRVSYIEIYNEKITDLFVKVCKFNVIIFEIVFLYLLIQLSFLYSLKIEKSCPFAKMNKVKFKLTV